MSQYIGLYVSHCDLCLRTKIQCRLPSGELQPLLIPEECWDVISIDFISELPESGGYDSVMVAVDFIGKCSHFIETVTTVTSARAANLYLRNVWKLHSLPQKVVSDHRPQFVAAFMKELYQLLEIEAATSTTYHPQTDGQTEWVNQELEQYLQIFVGERQDDWYTLLPLAEFSYNNHIHLSMQQTPFLLNTGDTHDLRPPAENAIVVRRTAIFRHLPKASAVFRRHPTSSAASDIDPPFPSSSTAPDIDLPPSYTFRPIVHSRKSRSCNELFPYVYASSMPCCRRLVSFRAAAVI